VEKQTIYEYTIFVNEELMNKDKNLVILHELKKKSIWTSLTIFYILKKNTIKSLKPSVWKQI
jgi:hypothetical protein